MCYYSHWFTSASSIGEHDVHHIIYRKLPTHRNGRHAMDRCAQAVSLCGMGKISTQWRTEMRSAEIVSVFSGCQGLPVAVMVVKGHRDRRHRGGGRGSKPDTFFFKFLPNKENQKLYHFNTLSISLSLFLAQILNSTHVVFWDVICYLRSLKKSKNTLQERNDKTPAFMIIRWVSYESLGQLTTHLQRRVKM